MSVLERNHACDPLEHEVENLVGKLQGEYGLSKRAVSLLLLQGDEEITALAREQEGRGFAALQEQVRATQAQYSDPLPYLISKRRQEQARVLVENAVTLPGWHSVSPAERLSRILIHPLTGLPILGLIVYFGLYQFVGRLGAGVLVDWIEKDVFKTLLTPWITHFVQQVLPWPVLQDLFVGEYGMLTLGLRYAIALILPIVSTFFLAFALLEDSGYLPRLALLIDRLFKRIGLTGRAVIPMVLGLGCDTMATLVTRTLPTRRERLIATLLLALAIPCSAQLGVILALLHGHDAALGIWLGVLIAVFLLVGYLSSRILPGEQPSFYMELPPLRIPQASNVLLKTYTRVQWYFMEIFPLFIGASVLIWLGRLSGLFELLTRWLVFPVRWLGLPDQAAVAFLFGFFRRDYGTAGLFDLKQAGAFHGDQLVVACVTMTLFLPCIAQFLINVKERGWRVGLGISAFVLGFSFCVGFGLHWMLRILGV
jgi:ferrous iron transport protein B